jgi:ParB-like chromosome segregation protein Spo0J
MSKQNFNIELRSIDSIRPYDKNPRHNDDAVDAVAASLREFGFRSPIVVDGDGVIICGHTRLKAAQKLGLDKVPVHVAKDLTPEKVKALRIADNQTSTLSDWDYDILPIELSELQDAGFDMGVLAFDEDELAKLLKVEPTEGLTDDDAVPDPPAEPITQPGDLWLLGAYWECDTCGKRYDYDAGKAMVDAGKECPCENA